MKLNELSDNTGAVKTRIRVGRGIGSGKGKTCGRGHKGQLARSGPKVHGFEGGQMPIYRRLPKRGFKNINKLHYVGINLDRLQAAVDAKKLDASKPVTQEALIESGVVTATSLGDGVKILGRGELKAKLDLTVAAASQSAVEQIEKAGGKVTVLEVKKYAQPSKKKKAA